MSVNKQIQDEGKSVATQALEKIQSDDKSTKKDNLLSLIPEGHSPKLYIDLIKSQVLGTSRDGQPRDDEDLMYFLYVSKRVGLDPLARQIYAVYRWDTHQGKEKMTVQTGIDGLRLIAQRAGGYAGQDEVKFEPEDESLQHPVKATVTVYKVVNGIRVPFSATARWSEYVQLDKRGQTMGLWVKMPYLMLGKCAEALALRKAFPSELSGIYSDVEMTQTSNVLADLPIPAKLDKAGRAVDELKVVHGAPVDLQKSDKKVAPVSKKSGIGSEEAKEVTEENKPKAEVAEPRAGISEIRKKIEETKAREHERNEKHE